MLLRAVVDGPHALCDRPVLDGNSLDPGETLVAALPLAVDQVVIVLRLDQAEAPEPVGGVGLKAQRAYRAVRFSPWIERAPDGLEGHREEHHMFVVHRHPGARLHRPT